MALQPTTPPQGVLDIGIEIQRDVYGIEMGVLENGIPFLTQTGLAKLAGVARSAIFDISQEWETHYDDPLITKDRHSFIREALFKNGYTDRKLYIEIKKDNAINNAYPDVVCMAVLEYYAFEAKNKNEAAVDNYRKIANYGLQKFIYEALKYTPADKWKYHNDRVSILHNAVPIGYYIIFNEVTGLIVDLINEGLKVDDKTIPDISVGQWWGQLWGQNGYDSKHGARIKYEHNYPSYYPQSASNPQHPWAYPDCSLAEFRSRFKQEYLPTRYPKYILSKSHVLGGQEAAKKIASLYTGLTIGKSD